MSDASAGRLMVSGGGGFLGKHIVASAQAIGWDVSVPRSSDYDLTVPDEATRVLRDVQPDVVIHAAADVGGIGYNRLFPADIFRNNLNMATAVLDAIARSNVRKVVLVGSACAYPGDVDGPMTESAFLDGAMHPSVEVYGLSKRAMYLGSKAYAEQFGLNSVFLLLTNLYGPEDKFEPEESHVVAALIRKFAEAVAHGDEEVVCWGTGSPVREFLFVEDCAEAIVRAIDVDDPEPLNIGTGVGTSIRELAELVQDISGFTGTVRWDTSMPDGAPYKVLDTQHMDRTLDWTPGTSLREGLAKTYEWFATTQLKVSMAFGS